jgi:multicomponent Na+:H+ antiporter subunit D
LLQTDGGEALDDDGVPPVGNGSAAPVQVAVLVSLALALVAAGVSFEAVLATARAAAEAALDTASYVEAVSPATSAGESGSGDGHSLLLVVAGPAFSRLRRLLPDRATLRRRWER